MKPFSSIESALKDFHAGKMLIVVDDEARENEGDFVLAADKITPDAINFMATHGRGLICIAMQKERLKALDLHPMVRENSARLETAFTVSVDAIKGTTTGISSKDRAATIRALLHGKTKPQDLGRPGHIFPLEAKPGGVLQRAGHTEAAVDLALMSQQYPAGVICEIMSTSGDMARLPELTVLAQRFGLKIITIKDLIAYRHQHEKLVTRVSTIALPTKFGDFQLIAFQSKLESQEHLALVKGKIQKSRPALVRVHSECLTGDILGSKRCDCGEQRDAAMKKIAQSESGVFLYLRGHEGRGIGLLNKLKAYELQEQGMDTVEANQALGFPADLRQYGIGAQILVDLGVRKMRLLTNNPRKLVGLDGYGLKIVERVPLKIKPNAKNARYLKTKRDKLGHLLGKM